MSKIKQLIDSYQRYMMIRWQRDAAPSQRVIFCVYPETAELALRARIGEFELASAIGGHRWACFDLTDLFARWMAGHKYAKSYFAAPDRLATVLHTFLPYLTEEFETFLHDCKADEETVVALMGVGALFGFVKVKAVVDAFAPLVTGRLVVLFPGSYENNNYRLLDGYDGWDYRAVPITPGKEF
ncbi:MAG: DUF1788 domain-containing protein [Caldilinea sp.]|nr:DUF1788 domain-containing protein [Caldilinea sp.]MCB0136674.1 DUF1788 domain-containing protein [Caldilineaceae bacterium]MCB0039768.1 DUF1788 domain-containing protein [Caldilinea sp.]MCB0047966.1 DUF1788 domain-containing protein [Caldilinea sp.]MCB0149307.1 DUF1788 domain-containing protein [Caldilineaceae bacterium]